MGISIKINSKGNIFKKYQRYKSIRKNIIYAITATRKRFLAALLKCLSNSILSLLAAKLRIADIPAETIAMPENKTAISIVSGTIHLKGINASISQYNR